MFSDNFKFSVSPDGMFYEVVGKVSFKIHTRSLTLLFFVTFCYLSELIIYIVIARKPPSSGAVLIYLKVSSRDVLFENRFSSSPVLHVQRVTRKNDGIDGALIGANASAEEADEGTEEGTVTDVDIILNHNLQPSLFNKKSYQLYVKDYMKS